MPKTIKPALDVAVQPTVFHEYVIANGTRWRDILVRFLARRIQMVLEEEFLVARKQTSEDALLDGNPESRQAAYASFQMLCIYARQWPRDRVGELSREIQAAFEEKYNEGFKSRVWTTVWCELQIANFTSINTSCSVQIDNIDVEEFINSCFVAAAVDIGCRCPHLFDKEHPRRFEACQDAERHLRDSVSDYIVSIIPHHLFSSDPEAVKATLARKTPLVGLRLVESSSKARAKRRAAPGGAKESTPKPERRREPMSTAPSEKRRTVQPQPQPHVPGRHTASQSAASSLHKGHASEPAQTRIDTCARTPTPSSVSRRSNRSNAESSAPVVLDVQSVLDRVAGLSVAQLDQTILPSDSASHIGELTYEQLYPDAREDYAGSVVYSEAASDDGSSIDYGN